MILLLNTMKVPVFILSTRSALVDLGKHLGLFNSDKEQEKPIQITFVKASEKQDGG